MMLRCQHERYKENDSQLLHRVKSFKRYLEIGSKIHEQHNDGRIRPHNDRVIMRASPKVTTKDKPSRTLKHLQHSNIFTHFYQRLPSP
mmetsp:Transcript_21949/g.53720  ORF Transcript_21949/g.53720 Transcript_21949/m.53720 type:complete len:88 (+) Transcript_21949:938-1201(+)